MPFLSKDWRSPGEEWVRYEGGWERRKTVIAVPGADTETENGLSPSLDLAETDISNNSSIPKKIFRRQSSKFASGSLMSTGPEDDYVPTKNDVLVMAETLDGGKDNNEDTSYMEQDSRSLDETVEEQVEESAFPTPPQHLAFSRMVAGCRPKIKTKPIIIPKSSSINNERDDDIKPLKTRYSFSNSGLQTDRLSSTLPRNRSGVMSSESKPNQDIPSSSDDFTDLDDYNDIDDEYEKISNPLSYHLKQHFRMRRRQISQRSISVNERTSHHHQSDDEKAQSTYKIECDNNYDVRRPTKDNDIPIINESRRSDYSTHQQRSSASPTSNIWLRLIEDEENIGKPFFPITLRNTREVAGFNGLAEALIRLDFTRAIRDVRRFNYVATLMQLLFSPDKLSQLPGAAQKVLFRMLEVVADTVYSDDGSNEKGGKGRRNEHVLRRLLEQLHTTMAIYHVWGSPFLGGGHLIKQHRDTRRKITGFVESMQTEFKQDLAAPGLVERLPEECIREILLRLNDPSDILRASQSCVTMDRIACEKRVWRELVQTHFTKAQIEFILSERPELKDNKDWQALHTALRRRYGIRQNFTEMLMLCRRCCALFWKSIGHPCLVPEHINLSPSSCPSSANVEDKNMENKLPLDTVVVSKHDNRQRARSGDERQFEPSPELFVPVTPQTFLTFFSV